MSYPNNKSLFSAAVIAAAAFAIAGLCGCASADVDIITRPQGNLNRPDFVLVQNLAVTPKEVELDRGVIAEAIRDNGTQSQTELETQIGHVAAKAFTDELVSDLRKAGIAAYSMDDKRKPTTHTLIIKGEFVQINQGNQTARVLIGFGVGNGDIRAMIRAYQNNKMIASASVSTSGGYKPGMLIPVAGGAAAGTAVASAAVSGGSTVLSESFSATIKADAQRAAKEVAVKLVQGYINHGWATRDDLDKINGMF